MKIEENNIEKISSIVLSDYVNKMEATFIAQKGLKATLGLIFFGLVAIHSESQLLSIF